MPELCPPYLGAAYYPEDWPLAQIDEDIALMKQAGCNVMRVGEFAWSRMETEEGRYDFDWLHLVVEKLGQAGMGVIMCTPTCTPPQWLAERYPEILFERQGKPMKHGGRRHACPTSPVYREHCARIVSKMAEEFGQDARIIGWQIDNEVSSPSPENRACTCPACRHKFQQNMREKFGTIEALNAAWGTDLWSQTYTSFSTLPASDIDIWHHLSLLTAWEEFISDAYVDFCGAQADILHRLTKHAIGTDMMPYLGVDYGDMHRKLDLVQFNHYNSMENLWEVGFWYDMIRPLKTAPFWNTETATCWNGAGAANGYKEPGFCVVNSWLPIAFGGEANLYWLWRQHWSGQELMHGAVVSSQGRPLHIFGEVQEIARGFAASAEFLNGTKPVSNGLGLHFSHKAHWIFAYQQMVSGLNYLGKMTYGIYHPLAQAQLRPDVLQPHVDLSPYKVIFSPLLPTLEEEDLRERLRQWIEAGGIWIAGPLTDTRTEHATKYLHAPFGILEEWGGVYCRYEIPGQPRDFAYQWTDGSTARGSVWYAAFEPRGAETLATYSEGPMNGLAAITRHPMGKGQVILLGTLPTPNDLPGFIASIAAEAGINPAAEATENLYVIPREGAAGKGLVVIEVENRPATLRLPGAMTDLLTGQVHEGVVTVAPYGVMVFKE